MNFDKYEVPFRDYNQIRKISEEFLYTNGWNGEVPVPIEEIAEFELDLYIRDIPNLEEEIETVGFLSNNMKTIWVDKKVYDYQEYRLRFTIAHEIGHIVLHKDLYANVSFSSIEEWKETVLSFDSRQYRFLESQANNFAGLALIPTNQLRDEHEKAVKMYTNEGFDEEDLKNSETVVEYLATWLARKFNVSKHAMKIRLKKEGLVENNI